MTWAAREQKNELEELRDAAEALVELYDLGKRAGLPMAEAVHKLRKVLDTQTPNRA